MHFSALEGGQDTGSWNGMAGPHSLMHLSLAIGWRRFESARGHCSPHSFLATICIHEALRGNTYYSLRVMRSIRLQLNTDRKSVV